MEKERMREKKTVTFPPKQLRARRWPISLVITRLHFFASKGCKGLDILCVLQMARSAHSTMFLQIIFLAFSHFFSFCT